MTRMAPFLGALFLAGALLAAPVLGVPARTAGTGASGERSCDSLEREVLRLRGETARLEKAVEWLQAELRTKHEILRGLPRQGIPRELPKGTSPFDYEGMRFYYIPVRPAELPSPRPR